MKALKISSLLMVVLLAISCSTEQDEQSLPKIFEKEFVISDPSGNTFNMSIQSKTEAGLNSVQPDDLVIKTFTEIPSPSNDLSVNELSEIESENEGELDEVYILVKEYDLPETFKGFSITHKDDLITKEVEIRTTTVHYSYGSWGTRGVSVTYLSEPHSRCANHYRLAQREWRPLLPLPYKKIWSTQIETPVETRQFTSCTEYDEYKLRIMDKGWRCDNANSSYMWLTSC